MASGSSDTSIMQSSAFSRTMDDYDPTLQGGLLSRGTFNFCLGLCLLWGFAVNAAVCLFFTDAVIAFAEQHIMVFLIGYIICAFGGIFLANASSSPLVSFIGYNLVVLPLGALLSVVVASYPVVTVSAAFIATAEVSVVLMIVSSLRPQFFLRMGGALMVALIACFFAEIVLGLLGFNLGIFDYIVAFIFCGYIGFDWARSQMVPPTLDNAIDCSISLYVDIINLFIRLLAIFGRRRN